MVYAHVYILLQTDGTVVPLYWNTVELLSILTDFRS